MAHMKSTKNFGYMRSGDMEAAHSYRGYRHVAWNPTAMKSIMSSGSPTAHNPHGGRKPMTGKKASY